jgi:hypothetical protein
MGRGKAREGRWKERQSERQRERDRDRRNVRGGGTTRWLEGKAECESVRV